MMMTVNPTGLLALAISIAVWGATANKYSDAHSSWQWKMFLNAFKESKEPTIPTNTTSNISSELLVIGAGLPRTGTDSLQSALTRLGYHTYHAKTVHPEGHHPVWKDFFGVSVAQNEPTEKLDLVIDAILDAGYNATTDFPSCLVAPHLARKFPNAKVILSVRDSADAWAKSYGDSVGMLFAQSTLEPLKSLTAERMGPSADFMEMKLGWNIEYGPGRRPTKESLARAYEFWNGYIQESIDPSRLLLHNAKDGWEPLCEHLEISEDKCPKNEPYPHINDRSAWRVIVALVCLFTDTWPYCLVIPVILLVSIILGTASIIRKTYRLFADTMMIAKAKYSTLDDKQKKH